MCDEITDQEDATWLNRRKMLAQASAALLMAGCGGPKTTAASPPEPAKASAPASTTSQEVAITTPDGEADGLFITPNNGKHPAVLLWPDIAGIRPAFVTMATRLAEAGYAVLLVNPYYRGAKGQIFETIAEWRTDAGRAKVGPMYKQLTPKAITSDGVALIGWLDQQTQVDTTKKVGTQGYCMSGSFGFRIAAALPERVGAFASFHGGGLVTEADDSPHNLLAKTKAAALVCIAQNDHARDEQAKPALEAAAKAAGVSAEIEVYDANHGWCALDAPIYDKALAERAWGRLLNTYAQHLV